MWHQSAHRQALHKQVASAAFSLTCLVCGAKLVQTVGMNKKKRAAMGALYRGNSILHGQHKVVDTYLLLHHSCAIFHKNNGLPRM